MKDADPAGRDRRGGLKGVDASACRFAADQTHVLIPDKMIKAADGVGAAADAGDHRVGQSALFFEHLRLDLIGDHRLKIADDGRKRMRSHDGAEAIVGVADAVRPLAHRFGHSVL